MNHKLSRLVPLSSILVEDRLRIDLGEVQELAESMRDNGVFHPPVVEGIPYSEADKSIINDGMPTFRGHDYRLLAGGRRMAAFTLLNSNKVEGAKGEDWTMVPVTVFDELPADQKIVVEVEENIKRKEMTWQETLAGIVKYHKAKVRTALQEGDTWSQSATGRLLNMNQAKVSIAFKVHDAIKAGNEKVAKAESLNEAIKVLMGEELDRAQAEQMRRIQLKRAEQAKTSALKTTEVSTSTLLGVRESQPVSHSVEPLVKPKFTPEQVASFYHHGNALEVLPLLAKNTVINHIITDPPYAIEMDNLEMVGVERIADTHIVEENLKLLPEFIRVSFDCIAEDGFMCMWYDLDHHEKIKTWAEKVGWKVCRWPFIWLKTSSCRNSQAQYNITKSSEVCYIFRRSEKSILKQKRSNNYLLASSVATAEHPFVKPSETWKWLIESVSTEGQTIFDGFAGQGSSLAAMFKVGRTPIGCEIDEKHIASGLSYVCEQINSKSILDDVLMPPL